MIQTGREFVKEDFTLDKKDIIIPLILGNAYKNQFEIGDTFSFFYLGKQFSGKVVAFLAKDSSIRTGNIKIINLDSIIVMPSFEISTNYSDTNFNKTLALIKTEGYVLYETQKEYQNILDKIDTIKQNTNVQYSYIENLDFIPLNQCYFMPKYLAFLLLILGEILFFCYMINMVKKFFSLKIINVLPILPIITFVTYEIAYISITKINNNALRLNIMRIRYTVITELLIIFVIVVSCRIYKIFSKGGITSENNRCN